MIYLLLADGFEEIEAITVVDILRRANLDVKMVSASGNLTVTGAHDIVVQADIKLADVKKPAMKMLILPGGMPGADNLQKTPEVIELILYANENDKYIAAICAAPKILGMMNILNGKMAVCFPGYEETLIGATIIDKSVVVDGNIITSKAAGTVTGFAFALVHILCGSLQSQAVYKKMLYKD